jgi:hypothetical protein
MRILGSTMAVLLLVGMAGGQEVEPLPEPRALDSVPQVLPPRFIVPLRDPPPEFGRRSVWQMMAPDQFGRFRPRVIYSPFGNSYYQYNGAPFPWTTTMPRLYMPYLVD